MDATPDFVSMADPSGRIHYGNRAARRLFGMGEDEEASGLEVPRFHPEWAQAIILGEGIPAAVREGVWSGDTALLAADGREVPVSQVILSHKAPDGTLEYLSTICRDVTERKAALAAQEAQQLALRELYELTATRAADPRTTIRSLLALGCRRFQLDTGILARVEADRYTVMEAVPPDAVPQGAVLPLAETYCKQTLQAATPVAFHGASSAGWQTHPCFERTRLEAYLGSPVRVGGELYGTLNFSSLRQRSQPFSAFELDFLRLMATWVGAELERTEALEEQRTLAAAGALMARTLVVEDLIGGLGEIAVESLADFCIIDEFQEPQTLSRLSATAADPAKRPLAERLGRLTLDPARPFLLRAALESGRPEILQTLPAGYLAEHSQGEEHLRLLTELKIRELAVYPLLAFGRRQGAVGFILTEGSARHLSPSKLRLAEELAHRAAGALDNARAYHAAQRAIRSRDEVLGRVAHDLRSPIQAASLSAQALLPSSTAAAGCRPSTCRTSSIASGSRERAIAAGPGWA